MALSNKQFLLGRISTERLRELATRWRSPITDARLRAPGIAKQLARKRSISVDEVLAVMTGEELEQTREQLGIDPVAGAAELRGRIGLALSTATWRQVRRANIRYPTELETVPARLLEVVDGDTLRVELEGKVVLVRLRGIDAPETSSSDKAERELDRGSVGRAEMIALGNETTRRLQTLVGGRSIYLQCQPTPGGPHKYLHHHQYRLLAFVVLDSPTGPDVGATLLQEGYALVWPRGIKSRRYSHQNVEGYIALCCETRAKRPGLWKRGLGGLCPREESPSRGNPLDECMARCFPGSLTDASEIEPDDTEPAGA